ncbi:hypothetical protein BC936DRAFT_147755, partial [Jimgerdemannia flammicorona]
GPRDYWCWVEDGENSLNTLLFFFLWEWIAIATAIGVLVYTLIDRGMHLGLSPNTSDYTGVRDMRMGCIIAFSLVLGTNVVVWGFASASRFWVLGCDEPKFGDRLGIALGEMQAYLGCSRGRKYIFRSQSLSSFLHIILGNILVLPIPVIAVAVYFLVIYNDWFETETASETASGTDAPTQVPVGGVAGIA